MQRRKEVWEGVNCNPGREKYLNLPWEYTYMMWDKKKYLLGKINAYASVWDWCLCAVIHIVLLIFMLQLWKMFVRNWYVQILVTMHEMFLHHSLMTKQNHLPWLPRNCLIKHKDLGMVKYTSRNHGQLSCIRLCHACSK